ncbi:MAG TPA: hypothetical protein VH374_24505 [Polyangia bacterium]|nr:hypothetical protein [Polyangia bacterium]
MPIYPQPVHRRRRAGAPAALVAAVFASACSTHTAAPDTGVPTDLVLAPVSDTVQIPPGDRGMLNFVLRTPDGAGVPGQPISFSIVDDPTIGSQPQGATLASDSALTDATGTAMINVNAGQPAIFRVHASTANQSAEAEAEVLVMAGTAANIQVAPFIAGDANATAVAVIEVAFFDNDRCAALSLAHLPTPVRPIRTVASTDGVVEFDLISTVLSHAVVGRARDRRGALQAQGCVDLPGKTLVPGDLVRVALPMGDADPSPVGKFEATSHFAFTNPPAAEAFIVAPWVDLQDCPLDPAQLWLDCTLDALSGGIPGDPDDCQPVDGGEGPIGAAVAARRGVLLPAAGGGLSACRSSRDSDGLPSHDALLAALFGAPKPGALVGLGGIADDAGRILSALTLRSDLAIAATPTPNVFVVTHTFDSVEFGTASNASFDVALLPLGLPVLQASYVRADAAKDILSLDEQRITLRLGTVAREAFGKLALATRGLPADSAGTVRALFALASTPAPAMASVPPTTLAGCAALDAVLCADIGQGSGCLLTACTDGMAALAARLDAGFAMANGDGLDLIIDSGAVPIIDTHNAGVADRLGDVFAVPPAPGTWSATLRTHAGNEKLTAQWEALRSGN